MKSLLLPNMHLYKDDFYGAWWSGSDKPSKVKFQIQKLSFWEKLWWAEKILWPVSSETSTDYYYWCEENCIGKWTFSRNLTSAPPIRNCLSFRKKSDALMFKLRWME